MLLVNKISLEDFINYKQEHLNCLDHNLNNPYISEIFIFIDGGHKELPKHPKIRYFTQKYNEESQLLVLSQKLSMSKKIIWVKKRLVGFFEDLKLILDEPGIYQSKNFIIINKTTTIIPGSGLLINEGFRTLKIRTLEFGELTKKKIISPTQPPPRPVHLWSPPPTRKAGDLIKTRTLPSKKLDLVIVSVNYNDFLLTTLTRNTKIFSDITVITSTEDLMSQQICQKFGVNLVISDIMYEGGAVFNKGKAINKAVESITEPGFILIIDADIIIGRGIDTADLDPTILYTSDRWMCKTYEDLLSWESDSQNPHRYFRNDADKGLGFFQLYHYSTGFKYPEISSNASFSDLLFRDKFTVRKSVSQQVIHLGKSFTNWDGRRTERFIDDQQFNHLFSEAQKAQKRGDFTLCSYYFNYNNDPRQKANFIKFLEQWKDYYDTMIVGIVDYGDIDFEIPCKKVVIGGDINKRIWSKEILLNRILEEVDTEYLIWVDGDLIYENLDWLETLDLVVHDNDFVQLFETINYLGQGGESLESHRSLISGNSSNIDDLLGKGYKPGGAWLGKTSILKKDKFFEKMFVGGGDAIFAYGLFGINSGFTLNKVGESNKEIQKEATEWIERFGAYKVGYLRRTVGHLYHGDLKDRNYNERYSKLINIKPRRIVVFTENIGDYDTLKPINKYENTTCVAFLDKDVEIEGWNIININDYPHISGLKDVKLICKYVRTHPNELLPEHDYSIHIDANMVLTEDPNKIVDEIVETNTEIMVFRHHKRNSIYEEGEKCIESKLDSETIIFDQMEKYRNFGIGNDLYECGLMLRKNTKSIKKFDDIWWEEIRRYSKRDQLSFPYATQLAGVSVGTFKIEDRRKSNLIKIDKDKRGNYIPTPHKKTRVFNNNLCFVYDDGRENWGSTKMRGRDIAKKIGCDIVSFKESKGIKYKKIVLLKMTNYEKSLCLTEFNEVVCDMVDFNREQHNLDTFKRFDYGIFTSVRQMEELRHIFKSPEKCTVIYHHWDERFNNIRVRDGIPSPKICYIGQPEKCYGKNTNIERHSIDWYDFDEKISLYEQYNVHYVVKPKAEDDKIQPLTKVATAASLGCPVIVNRSDHNMEILGSDYPYYCDPNDGSVDEVIEKVYNTFGKDEWYQALEKMKEIKEMTSLNVSKRIIKNYLDLGYLSQEDDINLPLKSQKIYGFYFAALMNDWKSIVIEQMDRLFHSKLFYDTDVLFIRVYYTIESDMDNFSSIVDSYRKNFSLADFNIRIYSTNENEYEFGILNLMKELAVEDEFYCYYLHSKGVSKIRDARRIEPIRAWRRYMEYFLIDKYSSCIESLKSGSDAVGVKIRETPASMEKVSGLSGEFWWTSSRYMSMYSRNPKHFSGNFWWSKSSYIMSLPNIDSIRSEDRHEAEFWIGYADGEMKCLHSGESAGYGQSIREEEYIIEKDINHF